MSKFKIYSLFFLFLIFIGCKKEGTGGKAQVSGFVIYNGNRIPNAVIYIKYGASSSPGNDPTSYDSQLTADAGGNFTFGSLVTGNYYLYAIGHYTTSLGFINVAGGTAVIIPHTKSTVNYDIAVSKQ
jgi:hypothetical protein